MKKFLILFYCVCRLISAHSQSYIQRVYGIDNNFIPNDIVSDTLNKEYLISGKSDALNGFFEPVILKINSTGDVLWGKTIGQVPGNISIGSHASMSSDNNYMITGYTFGFNYANFLLKLDNNGNTIWSKNFELNINGSYRPRTVIETSDNGYIICGNTYSDFYVVKTDNIGNIQWANLFGDTTSTNYEEQVIDAVANNSGGATIFLEKVTWPISGNDGRNVILLDIDGSGNQSWGKQYGKGIWPAGSLIKTSDDGYLIASYSLLYGAGSFDIYTIKTDQNGDTLWTRTYGNSELDVANTVIERSPNNYLIGGYSHIVTSTVGTSDQLLINIGGNGDTIWTKKYDGGQDEEVMSLDLASNDKIAMVSFSDDTQGNNNLLFNLTGSTGESGCNVGNPQIQIGNPSNTVSNISLPSYPLTSISISPESLFPFSIDDSVSCASCAKVQEICLITVDSTSTRNLVSWEKTSESNVVSYNIYREMGGNYIQIGSVPYDSLSIFIDTTNGINPQTTSYRYKLSVLDTCGFESNLSNYHETIHLTSSLGIGSEVNLIWDSYEGIPVSYYRILRDTSGNNNYEVIDSVISSNFTYTDFNAIPGNNNSYLIEVIPPDPCVPTKAANYSASRSNRPTVIPNIIPIVADFSTQSTEVFKGQLISFQDQTSGFPTSWNWFFESATTDTSIFQVPFGISYDTIGDFDVSLIASNPYFVDTVIKVNYLTVIENNGLPPSVDFVANTTYINPGDTVFFSPITSNAPYTWNWVFQGGSPSQSNLETPNGIVYNSPGIYDVSLLANNINGSAFEIKSSYINVGNVSAALENKINDEVLIFPNPNNGYFTISVNSTEHFSLAITNYLGQTVLNQEISGQNNYEIEIRNHGIYFITVQNKEGITIHNDKILVK